MARARESCRRRPFLGGSGRVLAAVIVSMAAVRQSTRVEAGYRQLGPDLSLWIDRKQASRLESFGFPEIQSEIVVIDSGRLDPVAQMVTMELSLPVLPHALNAVNVTWRGGELRQYQYEFSEVASSNTSIVTRPVFSIPLIGSVPSKSQAFQVSVSCQPNTSGAATVGAVLNLKASQDRPPKTLRLKFRLHKHCLANEPQKDCVERCQDERKCDANLVCQCSVNYMGQYCEIPLCYPPCLHGGTCVAPGICECPNGYQGPRCDGGICRQRCQNGGRCVQKDTCSCGRGYYGPQCQFSKCSIPCQNRGRCVGVNQCRCKKHFGGPYCQTLISRPPPQRRKKLYV